MAKDLSDEERKEQKSYWFRFGEILKTTAKMPRVFHLVWKAQPALASVFIVSQVLLGLVPLAQVWAFKLLVDTVPAVLHSFSPSHPASPANLPATIALALGLISTAWFLSQISRPLEEHCREQLNDYLTRDINLLLMDKVNSIVDISILENPKFYDKMQRIQNELTYKPIHMIHAYSQLGQALISLTTLSFVLISLNVWLVPFIFVLAAPKIILQLKQMYELWSVILGDVPEVRRMRYYTRVLTNNQDGKEIRLFGLGGFFRENFQNMFVKMQSTRSKIRNMHLVWSITFSALSTTGTVISYGYAVLEALNGHISTGLMAMYLGAIGQIESFLGYVAYLVSEMYRHTLYVNELFEFLDVPPAIEHLPEGTTRKLSLPLTKGIEFRNVSFRYPNSESMVLDGVSFTIEPGKTVALVGENGAGKTTIVKLLSRLYDPTSGEILIDGINLKELDAVQWRSLMSVVFQDYCRFQLTVRENIGVGHLEEIENLDAVRSAADRGGASSVVAKLDRGYDTMLGKMFEGKKKVGNGKNGDQNEEEIGIELSGGEWQKIALARAFMRSKNADESQNGQAQLLILDEPTASLDVQSEYDVYCRFHELTADKMALLITHRFSTVRIADNILVLEQGKVIEEGTHEHLMASDTSYSRLYNLQAERYK